MGDLSGPVGDGHSRVAGAAQEDRGSSQCSAKADTGGHSTLSPNNS